MDHLCFFCLVFVIALCASVYLCLVVTCLERATLFALVCGVYLWVCHFPIGILGQVWYSILSIPDLSTLTYIKLSSPDVNTKSPDFPMEANSFMFNFIRFLISDLLLSLLQIITTL